MGVHAENESPAWDGILFGALLVREVVLFVMVPARRRAPTSVSRARELAADVMLFFFQCIAFTLYWDALLGMNDGAGLSWPMFLFLAPFIWLVFMIVYLPIRLPDVLEPYFQPSSDQTHRAVPKSLFVSGAFLALYPLFWGLVRNWFM
jgi:hypothetical protein